MIARRIGVSQLYLFRLFPSKKALFLTSIERCFERVEEHLERAAKGLEGEVAFEAMCASYGQLVEDRAVVQMQLQAYAASIDDEEIRGFCQHGWLELWDRVAARTGVSAGRAARFFGTGMLVHVMVALGIPCEAQAWFRTGFPSP
ncbi:TetR/AcrR family transcriptional regulator [Streptomyces sp. NPDC088354]|uniref:TetR/AcrR family transcriptional regulator n=1 Tax=Streptomyces sp. NPDC088354 TaxID=3365856 RepID=UPI00381F280B